MKNLDPHSVYIPARRLDEVNEELQGNFEGIGVQFRVIEDTVVLLNIISGGPSEKVGLRAGDRIVLIEEDTVAGVNMDSGDIVKRLKGKRGTEVDIHIFRKGFKDLIPYTIIRDVIPNHSVDVAYMVDDSIGYIKLAKFSETAYQEVHKSILKLQDEGMTKLIFDLRGNSGGYMAMAIQLCDDFLTKDKLIVYTEGTKRPRRTSYATEKGIFEDEKLVILIDENSASASEIIAGAIQDNDRGIIVGRRSFGKGLVQEQVTLADGSGLRMTVARYYTPAGRSIQKPYENGVDNYHMEYYERYSSGELISADSVKFNDSLKYYTAAGRTVYGGGGIMPDVFVPLKWDDKAIYYNKIINMGHIYQFAYNYTDNNRNELNKYVNANDFIENFVVTDQMFDNMVAYADEKGLKKSKGDKFKDSIDQMKTLLKSYIGRNIFDNDAFYPIYHKMDPGFEEAVKVLHFDNKHYKEITAVQSNI
jgi:carboxyl-terminal processing protease